MLPEEKIALECPSCGKTIYETLSWFRETYTTCPSCGGGIAAAQFADILREIEKAFDATDEEIVHGKPCSGGCCGEH